MGTLYGGLAHVPIASLVMVCELAGNYDLLVPLMLATGISFMPCAAVPSTTRSGLRGASRQRTATSYLPRRPRR